MTAPSPARGEAKGSSDSPDLAPTGGDRTRAAVDGEVLVCLTRRPGDRTPRSGDATLHRDEAKEGRLPVRQRTTVLGGLHFREGIVVLHNLTAVVGDAL